MVIVVAVEFNCTTLVSKIIAKNLCPPTQQYFFMYFLKEFCKNLVNSLIDTAQRAPDLAEVYSMVRQYQRYY